VVLGEIFPSVKLSTGGEVHERLEVTVAALISLWNKSQAQAERGCGATQSISSWCDTGGGRARKGA
jgi:hypothetical protein